MVSPHRQPHVVSCVSIPPRILNAKSEVKVLQASKPWLETHWITFGKQAARLALEREAAARIDALRGWQSCPI